MTTFLVRHGQTKWNIIGRKQGQGDSPLSPKGRKQAIACGTLLSKHISQEITIFVSPLGRAKETSDLVCSVLGNQIKEVITVPELAELDYGLWQGLTDEEIDEKFPFERMRRYENHWGYQIPNGESYAMVERRYLRWKQNQKLEDTLIIAHEMINRVILGSYLQLPKKEILKLKHPQNIVYKLSNQTVSELSNPQFDF
ncbi:MAG: histidine phosphatase family protein [Chloroflexota bacterium]